MSGARDGPGGTPEAMGGTGTRTRIEEAMRDANRMEDAMRTNGRTGPASEPGRGSGTGRRTGGRALRAAGALAAAAVAAVVLGGAAEHISPTVVLEKQADVIRSSLPDARQFFLKTVRIGRGDFARIEREADFEPEDAKVKFYYGEGASGTPVGVVLFPQVNTQHGPFEVGLTIGPDGTVQAAEPTKATVETRPWVEKAVGTGFLDDLQGMTAGQEPAVALRRLRSAGIGKMPTYAGEQLATAVERGLALYQVLYAGGQGG